MLHRITAKLRERIALRKKHHRILQRSKARMDELAEAIESARAERDRQKRILERRTKRGAPEAKINRTAERLEAVYGVLDQLLERADNRREKNRRLTEALKEDAERIEQLRKRRRRILVDRQDNIGRFWHMSEFDCREGGPVPDYMRDDLDDLANRVLDKLRARFGIGHVNSGHRWVFYNQKIGGAPGSYHCYEVRQSQPAADCTFATGRPSDWAAYARSLGVGGVGQYSTFVHVDTGPRRDWWG